MTIKYLNLHELEQGLPMPEKEELHILINTKEDMENLHKNLREACHILLRRILSLYTKIPEKALPL